MSRAKKLCELMDDTEVETDVEPFAFPTEPNSLFPFDLENAKVVLTKKLDSLGITGIQVDDIESDEDCNIVVTFTDLDDNAVDVMFSYGEEGATATILDPESDKDDEDNIVVDLDPLGVPLVSTPFGEYINLLVLDWLNKSTMETILTAGSLLDKGCSNTSFQKDAFGNINIIPAEGYEYDIEKIELDNTINEVKENGEIVEVAYKVVVRGGKKVRRPIVRRLRKKRLTSKQRAGLRKASITRKSPKSKMKKRKSTILRKRLHLKPTKSKKGFRVG